LGRLTINFLSPLKESIKHTFSSGYVNEGRGKSGRVKKNYSIIAVLITFCCLVFLFQSYTRDLFAYQYSTIHQGEWWRLVTNSLVHTNLFHLIMNLLGLLLILFIFMPTFKQAPLFSLFIFNTIFISFCLYYLESHRLIYVGLSGTLHGLFSYAVCRDILRKDKWGIVVALLGVLKIIGEQYFDTAHTTSQLINAPVLVNAHLYGAMAGVIFFTIGDLLKHFITKNT